MLLNNLNWKRGSVCNLIFLQIWAGDNSYSARTLPFQVPGGLVTTSTRPKPHPSSTF